MPSRTRTWDLPRPPEPTPRIRAIYYKRANLLVASLLCEHAGGATALGGIADAIGTADLPSYPAIRCQRMKTARMSHLKNRKIAKSAVAFHYFKYTAAPHPISLYHMTLFF